MRILFIILLTALLFPVLSAGAADRPYPYTNAYRATVYGTPPELKHQIEDPVTPKERSIRIKGRNVPDIFSYSDQMFYTTALQRREAPLIFIVAGTGAEHDSAKMQFLVQVFYQAGFHVVALSSPTHMNFVVSVSEHAVPGYVPHDVADLYRVMLWIKQDMEKRCEISGYSVTGYSLGALHSAFLAHMDSEKKDFNFEHVLMINPPVSLYDSVRRLDGWLTSKSLDGRTVHEELEHFINQFSVFYEHADVTDLDDNFLYELVTHIDLEEKDLKALIGVDFRVSSSSMIFSSDVCKRAGYIVPPDAYPLGDGDPLMPYAESSFEITFEMYLDEYLLPYLRYLYPTVDRATLLNQCSLRGITPYLRETDKIMVIGNRDDVILDKNDVEYIELVFGDRARLFPHGGHCGNMAYGPFVEAMVKMVKP